jgi:O-antigen/teichoic acid export membrane protein
MNLRISILANYLSQFYVTLVSMALVPVYLRHMGAEAYGLVGFFSMLFSLFYLLDMGLTPTISRETARFHGGVLSAQSFRQLFRAMSLAFALVAVLGALGIWLASDWVVGRWFKLDVLPHGSALLAVQLMALTVAMRWMGGLYRGVLSGGERMVWLPAFNAIMATLRFVGVLAAMQLWGYTVQVFFTYQLAVALTEFAVLGAKTVSLLPPVPVVGWSFGPLRPLLQFGLITAVSSALGVLLMQVDKFLLSGLLPLAEYGHFSLAVVVATSVMVVSAPISTALMPRMARLHAERREPELLSIYRLSTRLTSSLGLGGALTLAFCAHPLLTTWTGDAAWAHEFWPVLSLYAVGYGFWALGAFPYYLQYARGQLRWYLWGNLGLLCIQVPAVVWAAGHSGAVGAGMAWLVLSGLYLVVWGAVVHRRLSPGLHMPWLFRDVLAMNWPVLLGMLLVGLLDLSPQSRRETFAYVVLVGGFLMLSNLAWLAWSERKLWQQWRKG